MTRREELERRYKNLSTPNNGAWAALVFQVAALIWPEFGLFAIPLILFWLFAVWLARWATAHELDALARKEEQDEADAIDFIRDRNEQIRLRMQAMLEAEARARFQRQGSREMFKGNCVDITVEK